MNTRRTFITVKVSTDAEAAHHIHFRWPVTITGLEFLEAARRLASYMKLRGEPVKGCGLMKLPEHSYLLSLSASPEWTMPSMSDATPDQHIFAINAHIKVSAPLVTYSRIPAKLSTLVVPSQIASAECTDTINRTLEVTYFALSLYSGEDWQEMRRSHYVLRKARRLLPLR